MFERDRHDYAEGSDSDMLYRLGYAHEINRLLRNVAVQAFFVKVASKFLRAIAVYGEANTIVC
jgi:hypothetical protein